ncbi:MAG TPA: HAD family acid phosphatase [Gaiellaceae bacterium]|nr:HAD family acid phosphatase [Gaiellaceae bacterium]
MRGITWVRRSPRLAGLLVLVALAVAGTAAAVAPSKPADLNYVPRSASEIQNIDVVRDWISNYYGDPGRTGNIADDSSYATETRSVAADGASWLKAHKPKSGEMKAIVLDVDDTTLATWNYEVFSKWIYDPGTNGSYVTGQLFPAVPGMVDMVTTASQEGYAVFFLTGRPLSQFDATLGNLTSDSIGVDAGYPTPTTIGRKGPGDDVGPGLFTKPPVGSYPGFLDKPEFCADAIAAHASCSTVRYKSGVRAYIESQGYDIVASFGDQFNDLEGGFADKTFKMPNPNYYLS